MNTLKTSDMHCHLHVGKEHVLVQVTWMLLVSPIGHLDHLLHCHPLWLMAFAPISSVQSKGPFSYSTDTCLLGHSCRVEPRRPTSPGLRISVLGISVFCKGCETFQRTICLWGSISEFVHRQLFFSWIPSCNSCLPSGAAVEFDAPLDPDETLSSLVLRQVYSF